MNKLLALAAGLACLYLCFLTASHYWDGVLFSLYIEKVAQGALPGAILFHPNHLLYSGFGYLVYQLLQVVGLSVRSITALQLMNVLASVFCSTIIFRLCKRLFRSPELVLPCTLLFALGATWWKFSTDADSYIIAVLLLVAGVSLVLTSHPRIVPAGMCLVAAMLFHELAIFGYVPIMAAIWSAQNTRPARLARVAGFLTATGASVMAAYYVAYISTHSQPSPSRFLGWITSVSHDTKTTHSLGQLFVANASSYIKLFGGGKVGLIGEFFSLPVAVGILISVACLVVAIAKAFGRQATAQPTSPELDRTVYIVLWSWVAVYLVFLSWFEPGNAFYKLFIWPPIVLLIGCYIDGLGNGLKSAFGWLTLGLASWNFAAFIYPHSQIQADPVLTVAKKIDKELPKSATVYYKSLSPDDWYLEYFAPGRNWKPLPPAGEVQRGTAEAPVCFESTALPYVQAETDPTLRWNLVNSQHNVRLECAKTERD